jgi:hypothetical protein
MDVGQSKTPPRMLVTGKTAQGEADGDRRTATRQGDGAVK